MIDYSQARISKIASTWVGNKNRYESFLIPKNPLVQVTDVLEELLLTTFLKPFEKNQEFWNLGEPSEPTLSNVVRVCAQNTFENTDDFQWQIAKLTEALYQSCDNPKIQGGEFFAILFEDLLLHGEPCSAIGLWKIEGKSPYFRTERNAEVNILTTTEGIATAKPQVAAMIFNIDSAEGYTVLAVDSVSKKDERSFWKDEFMRLVPIQDDYFQTRHTMNLTAEFIQQKAPFKFGLNRVETIAGAIKALDYFKDNDEWQVDNFAATMFPNEEQAAAFLSFREDYAKAYALDLSDLFEIVPAAVKRDAKAFHTSIKLDKNFGLSIKGRPDLVERGLDEERGMRYYKIFFEIEE